MTPISLRIERFGSIVEAQTFEFPTKPGLYFLSGKNGSGKSTLWKALTWCIFGKDAKGLKAGDVANWKEPKGASVAFDFASSAGETLRVTRTHSPNTWTLSSPDDPNDKPDDLTKDETNGLAARLMLNYEMWLNTVLLAQDEPMFLDLKPDAKASLFAEVMNLSKWDDYSQNASRKAAAQDVVSRGLEADVARLDGELVGIDRHIAALPLMVQSWQRQHQERRDTIAIRYEALLKVQPGHKRAFDHADNGEAVARSDLAFAISKVNECEARVVHRNAELRKMVAQDARIGSVYAHALQRALELNSMDVCPTCGTADVLALGEAAKREQEKADDFKIDMEASERLLADEEAHVKQAGEWLTQAHDGAKKARTALDAASHTLRTCRTAVEACNQELDRLDEQVEELERERNPHAIAQETADADRASVRDKHREAARTLDESATRASLLGFWVRGFKELRLVLIAEALDHLALEVSSCVSAVGLSGWELTFEVDRETKKGTIARGFNVFVKGPANERQVPWEAWSGGEAQRLRIAAQCGLANLIRNSTGASIALEVWDEPTHGVEAQGIADLLEALRARAQTEQRIIFVTDHHALGSAAFDGTVTVTKTRRGTEYGVME